MKKILVDLDDVLAFDSFLNTINKFFNTNYSYSDTKGYYLENLFNKEQQLEFKKYIREANIYDNAVVADNSKEVLEELSKEYEIYICSSFYSELDDTLLSELVPRKCEFLKKNYPFLKSRNFMFLTEKSMIKSDIQIDDRIDNLKGDGIKLLFTAYHNKDITDEELKEKNITRVNNWLDIKNYLQTK